MTKKVIAIISVLKPVDDTRNFEKIARTLGNKNKYDINIIGFSTKIIPTAPNIRFYPIFNFNRIGFNRLFAPIKIYQILLKVKPQLIIVTCSELLIVSALYKILFGSKIIYDLQENYYRNIAFTDAYHPAVRYPIAIATRIIEYVTSVFIDHFILAEKIYKKQLKFIEWKYDILENKAIINEIPKVKSRTNEDKMRLVYAGTIAEHYGIFDALNFCESINNENQILELYIVGYAHKSSVYQKLIEQTAGKPYIKIIGGNTLVTHNQILIEMSKADFCLLPYQYNKSIEGRIPTKLFECLAMEISVIISPNPSWTEIVKENNAGIIYEFQGLHAFNLNKLQNKYFGKSMSSQYLWDNNENRLLQIVNDVIL